MCLLLFGWKTALLQTLAVRWLVRFANGLFCGLISSKILLQQISCSVCPSQHLAVTFPGYVLVVPVLRLRQAQSHIACVVRSFIILRK
jgi:hypothetical protein